MGGNRTFRPAQLARELNHLDVVNIGAAGTFVVRKPATQATLRAEFVRRLPFETEIMICKGQEIVRLLKENPFGTQPERSDITRFVTVLAKRPKSLPATPIIFPASGQWLLKILAIDGRFLFGVYRRQMKAIDYLGKLDRSLGVPATTRNWNTINAIAKIVSQTSY